MAQHPFTSLVPRPSSLVQSLRGKRIGVVGAGNMGQALIKGLIAAGLSPRRIFAVEPNPATRRLVARKYQVGALTIERLAACCDVVIIAVKPQDIRSVLEELNRGLDSRRNALLISIAAGVRTSAIERIVKQVAVVRVMPNLPAKVSCGISALARGRFATSSHRALAKAIFQCVGEVVELPERLFDAVTAISGSGPAYFFLVFQALRDAGVCAGLPKSVAQRLVVQTAFGSSQLVNRFGGDLDALIAGVASKRGTTEAALKVFRQKHLFEILKAGVLVAARRSKELSVVLEG